MKNILQRIFTTRRKIRTHRMRDGDILDLVERCRRESEGGVIGGQCKVWVQKIFRETLNIKIPLNHNTDKWRFENAPDGWTEREGGLLTAVVGDIIQAKWLDNKIAPPYNWHTMIVIENKRNSIVAADSNWHKDKTVRIHEIEHEWFLKTAERYSVYHCDTL